MQFIIIGGIRGKGEGGTRAPRGRSPVMAKFFGQVLTAIKCIAGAAGGPSSNLFVSHASGALNAHLHTDI